MEKHYQYLHSSCIFLLRWKTQTNKQTNKQTHTHTHTHILLLEKYPISFLRKMVDFNEARLHEAILNIHTHEAILNIHTHASIFSRLSIASVHSKQHLSKVVFKVQ